MSGPRPKPFEALRRFTRPEPPVERCGLCGNAISAQHEHLCAPGERKLLCACHACAILFSSEQAARYRRVTPKLEAFPIRVSDGDWAALGVPVGLTFFYRSIAAAGVVAVYPSPAGPLETLVDAPAWESLVANNPGLDELEPDVEALLVNRVRGANDSFCSSIDHCYHLIGLVRAHWQGFSGGPELWDAVDAFFANMRTVAGVAHPPPAGTQWRPPSLKGGGQSPVLTSPLEGEVAERSEAGGGEDPANEPAKAKTRRSADPAELIARAVLYEGYILYPYRASAVKNRHRWTFGGLAPQRVAAISGEPWFQRAECLLRGTAKTELVVRARFLHPLQRTGGGQPDWQEAVEREACAPAHCLGQLAVPRQFEFAFPASETAEESPDGRIERVQRGVELAIDLRTLNLTPDVFRLTVRVCNLTPFAGGDRDEIAPRTLLAAHVAVSVRGGEFVSLTDPPEGLRDLAASCRNEGVWPVLVGEPGNRSEMLASPIILPDYPRVAPESTGDFFDGTEIDEMLALRVLTLTDDEKREMAASDPRARAILERVESLPEGRMRSLHGANRTPRTPRTGDRVRLRPRGRADAFDVLLAGRTATVVSVEVDFEGATHFAVTVDDDPGGDLGTAAQIGHRFFFRPDEVELLAEGGL